MVNIKGLFMLNQYDFIDKREFVSVINKGIIYYVYTGRNAWHSTWITRYSNGCMHNSLQSARAFCERRRVQGTVFNILELPCLVFRSNNSALIVTEINTENPLSGYSSKAISEEKFFERISIYSSLVSIALSFKPESRFWKMRPPLKNSTIILTSKNPGIFIEDYKEKSLLKYVSCSVGSDSDLGFYESTSEIIQKSIMRVYREALIGYP